MIPKCCAWKFSGLCLGTLVHVYTTLVVDVNNKLIYKDILIPPTESPLPVITTHTWSALRTIMLSPCP